MSIDRLGIFGDKPTDESYKDALQHIKNIIDLEWNGMITITEYKERIEDVVLIALDDKTEKESKWVKKKEMKEDSQS